MNIINKIIFIFTVLIAVNCSSMYKEEFIPTQETCGAAGGKNNVPDNIHTRLKCMIAGFKDVYFGSDQDLDELTGNEKDAMQVAQIEKIIIRGNALNDPIYGNTLILYTPVGKNYATLLAKYETIHIGKIVEKERKIKNAVEEKDEVQKKLERVMNDYIEISNRLGEEHPETAKMGKEMRELNNQFKQLKNDIAQLRLLKTTPNHFLVGTLLGYNPASIKNYYEFNALLDQFEADKKAAELFMEENK